MEQKKVLLIEDNRDDAELAMLYLESKFVDIEFRHISNGIEALDFLFGRNEYSSRKFKDLPNIILLDLKMPKVNGHEVLREIKSHNRLRHIPIIVFTSSLENSDLKTSYEYGANSYVQKPVSGDEFEQVVEMIGTYWMGINQLPL